MTPSLRIRALSLRVDTDYGAAGRTLRFTEGLNLLRADNTSGKSTALQAMIYALGLEGMLSPTRRVPLPHAMTDTIYFAGRNTKVLKSSVMLEISNGAGEVITVERSVVDPLKDIRLVTVHSGSAVTGEGEFVRKDYFVRTSGAAQNEAGFHRFLAEFLGLSLPRVSKLDGGEVPLYLETLFPYFYVEQKHGWSGLQARIPNYFGIRDVGKRSAEFILGLKAFEQVLLRQRLSTTLSEIEAEWQSESQAFLDHAKSARVVVQSPPGRVSHGLGDGTAIPVVSLDNGWVPLSEAISELKRRLAALDSKAVPTAGAVAAGLEGDLRGLESSLQQTAALSAGLWDERNELQRRIEQVDARLEALEEDLQRHKDSGTLLKYGAEHAHDLLAEHVCPTCHQDLQDGSDVSKHAMTIAENIAFIQRQVATFKGTRADSSRVLAAIDIRLDALESRAHEYRGEIRAVKDTLASATSTPSISEVRTRLQLQEKLSLLEEKFDEITAGREALVVTARQWAAQKNLLDAAAKAGTSDEDKAKLDQVEYLLRGQLDKYGFKSLETTSVDIDRESYRPVNDGFDLGFDLSASDMIRVIWSYLFAFLKVGSQSGNHLGLLMFDEPRQQETNRGSYQALLAHAATEGVAGAQIIFATSEESGSLRNMIGEAKCNIIDLPPNEKLLTALASRNHA